MTNPKVSNPYSKKTQVPSTARYATSTSKNAAFPSATSDIPTGAATFSQAFSSIEDTPHYQSEVGQNQGSHVAATARADQRTFDSQAARDEAARLEAREAHAMMQPHVLYVSIRQKGNGVLQYIRNVPYAFSNMVPDYIMSTQKCALFLSLKYHSLYPNYIHKRVAELKTDFKLRVLLVLVDVEDNANVLLFLNRLAVVNNLTLILAWTEEEAARYLETFKAYDGKDASSIQRREQNNFVDQVSDFLCSVRSVNKTDAAQLLSQFTSVKQIMAASPDELALCPGMGEKKVQRLWDAFHKPFSTKRAREGKKAKQAAESEFETNVVFKKDEAPEGQKKGSDNGKDASDFMDEKKASE
jgi:DNA excision repair protein ERCC-1